MTRVSPTQVSRVGEGVPLIPTDEQAHIVALAQNPGENLMIDAYAGTGKTATLKLIEESLPPDPLLYLVFNRKNADDATKEFRSTTTVRTFNGLGHRVWNDYTSLNCVPSAKKSADLLRELIKLSPRRAQGELWACFWDVVDGIAKAKAHGYIPPQHAYAAKSLIPKETFHATLDEDPSDLTADLIDAILVKSIALAYKGQIDFNDQIYMPTLFGGSFPRYPRVLVDEYQDLNAINHKMLERLVKGWVAGVGDPWQSIYAFRGAKRAGMSEAVSRYAMTRCDLSISFRCPSAIVKHVQWRVPKFRWLREGGAVEAPASFPVEAIPDGAAIICRNNAPLFKLALQLLAAGRSVSVAGSDIGPKLLAMLRKLGPDDLPREGVMAAISEWLEARQERGSTVAQDLADCMRVFASFGATLGSALGYAEHVFKQRGELRLLTGHKAKGLEWPTVFHLDPWLLSEEEQDLNLRYVISTRSRDRLYEVNSLGLTW